MTLIDMCLSVHPLRMPLGPPPLPPRSPPLAPLDPPQENILSRSRNLIPKAILSDVIHHQLTDVCFLDIGTREDQVSQKPLFHHDEMEDI